MPDSFDYTTGTNSENVRLLQALIDDAPEYTEETNSRNANILKSIINNTEYTDAPQSEIEELLLRLKAKIGGEIEVDELTVTENGTYDAGVNKAYNPVKVELPLDGKTITENGTYQASDDNLAGYDEVTVAVEGYAKKSISNTPTDIATFNASALPMPSLTVGIEATQSGSGDPSPTNVRPFTGWSAVNVYDTGKNLFDKTQTFTKDKYIDINGNIQNTTYGWKVSDYIPLKNNTSYCISGNNATGASACNALYDKDKNLVRVFNYPTGEHNGAFSTNANEFYIRICTQDSVVDNVQIEEGTTATTYEPYSGQVYTIDLDGTRYGCTLDVVSGVMVVDRVIVDIDGSENGWSTDQVGTQNRRRFTCIGLPSLGASEDITFDAISNMFVNTKSSDYINMDNVFILRYLSQYRTNRIDIMTETYQDLTAFKSFLSNSNLTVVYELATPQTIQLTPTAVKSLLGTNNLWADSGKVISGEYMEAL